jgi:energy-converting hydrogenase Eha subunit E
MTGGDMKAGPRDRTELEQYGKRRTGVDLSTEVVLLVAGGMFFLIFGILLSFIQKGQLPYSEDGMYGLFVILVSLQVITMGKTPFGDLIRTWPVVIAGLCTSVLGTLALLLPGYFSGAVRLAAGLILLVAGLLGLLQLTFSSGKARRWLKVPGVLQYLTVACAVVYSLEVVLGVITLVPGVIPGQVTPFLLVVFGMSLFTLAWCIHAATSRYPPGRQGPADPGRTAPAPSREGSWLTREVPLTVGNTFSVYQGVLMVLLGSLVMAMILGVLPPFNTDGELGLLLVMTSLQMMALGQFIGSRFTRSWAMVAVGLVFTSLGVFSCIVPGVLTHLVQPLIGVQNILTGVMLLATQVLAPTLYGIRHPPEKPARRPPVVRRLFLVLAAIGCVTIIFGTNTLAPLLLPGLLGMIGYAVLLPALVVLMGCLSLVMVSIMLKLQRLSATG